ncbi:hypothetical protein MMC14_007326, partial [Varicellaria rhodocarpa]|nr:hypothetical protein [Varicellaria rhodocarpa]
ALISSELLWVSANSLVKLSVLHLYMSIFQALRFFCNMACVIAIAVIVFWIAVVIRSIAICQPFAYNWNRTIGGTCGDRPLAYLLTAVFNMILDLSIISAPMPQLWQLQVSTSKKWILTVAATDKKSFNRVCVMTILRIISVVQFNANTSDKTYSVVDDSLWSTLESTIGITTASLPVLRPVLDQ